MPTETPTTPALLSKKLIRKFYLPAAERTLDRWVSSGTFPKADIAIGGKVRYWKRESIEAWINAQTRGEAENQDARQSRKAVDDAR